MARDFMQMLSAYDDAVNDFEDPHKNVVRVTRSPSVNFSFGNGHGLPRGYSLVLYGKNKGGKTPTIFDTIGALHQDNPNAWALYFDSEFRVKLQLTPAKARMYGIDLKRFKAYQTNSPDGIFDRIATDVPAWCEEGVEIGLIAIDSTSAIQGRRETEAESVMNQTIGDHAQMLQIGLKRILPVIRRHNIACILTTHVRAEMDAQEQRKGNTVKMQAGWALKHFAEYFAYVERLDNKDSRTDIQGRELVNEELKDIQGKAEITGHKIRWTMKENNCGPRGRGAIFTYDYSRGLINLHEEVFLLGKNRGVIETKGSYYSFNGQRWNGEKAAAKAIGESPELQRAILEELKRQDQEGFWGNEAAADDAPDIETLDVGPGAIEK